MITEKESNKLIAEFMRRSFYAYKGNSSYKKKFKTAEKCTAFILKNKLEGYAPEIGWELGFGKYHSSWDWLMPVVEKIENLDKGYKFKLCRKRVDIVEDWGTELFVLNTKGKSKIESAWLAVVEFIKWYNQNKQS